MTRETITVYSAFTLMQVNSLLKPSLIILVISHITGGVAVPREIKIPILKIRQPVYLFYNRRTTSLCLCVCLQTPPRPLIESTSYLVGWWKYIRRWSLSIFHDDRSKTFWVRDIFFTNKTHRLATEYGNSFRDICDWADSSDIPAQWEAGLFDVLGLTRPADEWNWALQTLQSKWQLRHQLRYRDLDFDKL